MTNRTENESTGPDSDIPSAFHVTALFSKARTEDEIRSWFVGLGMECNKDYEITVEEMTQLHAHNIPDSENAKCLLACVYKKAAWVKEFNIFYQFPL